MIGGLIKSSSRIALVAAAGVAFGGVAAKAADLGGDCCADLEERVAELEATTARKGNRKQSLTVYGQIARAMVWYDDEGARIRNNFTVGGDDDASSRFGFRGSAKINADLSAGYRMEIQVDDDTNVVQNRHTMLYITSQQFGTIKLGRTDTASAGIAEIALAGGISFNSDGCAEFPGTCNAPALDPGNRDVGIHYVSPVFAGFAVSASFFHNGGEGAANQDGYDVALRYAGEFGAIRVAAGVGYYQIQDDTNNGLDEDTTVSGSASIMHVPSGVFLNAAYGVTEDGSANTDTTGWAVSTGIQTKLNSLGDTTFEVGYATSETDGADANPYNFSASISQDIDAAAMNVYIEYLYNNNDATPDQSSEGIIVGASVQF